MAKIELDNEKIKKDLNSVANRAIPRILILSFLGALVASAVDLIAKIEKQINPDDAALIIMVARILGGLCIAFFLYEIIYGIYLVISLKIKAAKGKFTVEMDELVDREPCKPVGLKFRFRLLPRLKDYHFLVNFTALKNHGTYITTSSEDDGHLRYINGNDKVYVVLVNGVKEPMLLYTDMIYTYGEQREVTE